MKRHGERDRRIGDRKVPGAEKRRGIGRVERDFEGEGGEGEERESDAMEEEREREGIEEYADEKHRHRSLAVQKRRRHGRTPPESGFTREQNEITQEKNETNAIHAQEKFPILIPIPFLFSLRNALIRHGQFTRLQIL